jgi:endonuclease/exonuclease/phosphatase family metal-dependent hydrolase
VLLSQYIDNSSYLIDGEKETYPSNNPYMKIDYIFTKNLKVKDSKVVKKIVSDHFPIVNTIEI